MLDKVTKVLPIAYIALTVIGFLKQAIYYRIFGVNIFEYLQLSEVLIVSTNDISLYIILAAITVIVFFVLDKSTNSFEESELIKIYNKSFWTRHIAFSNKMSWAMASTAVFFSADVIFFGDYKIFTALTAMAVASFISFFYLVILIEIARVNFISTNQSSVRIVFPAQVLTIFVFFLTTFTIKQALDIKFKTHKENIKLYSEEVKTPIDGSYVFIGKTDKYIFVFDFKTNTTDVYSTDFIKKIVLL